MTCGPMWRWRTRCWSRMVEKRQGTDGVSNRWFVCDSWLPFNKTSHGQKKGLEPTTHSFQWNWVESFPSTNSPTLNNMGASILYKEKNTFFFARKNHWISRPHSTVLTIHRWWTARRLGRRCTDVAKTGSVIICFGAQLPEFLGCIHCASAETSSYNAILPSWLTGRF